MRHDECTPLRRVLVTGAAGRIGSAFATQAHSRYDLRLMVREADGDTSHLHSYGEVVTCDLLDLPRLKEVCQGMDTVVHLAANPSANATWQPLLQNNIIGTYHLYVAAKAARCRRVVFASSIHAVSGYPTDTQVKTQDPVNPGDLYGVSKCFGEALGRYIAEQEGLSVIAVRIGAYQAPEAARAGGSTRMLDAFVSPRDLHHLLERCIEIEDVRFAIVHGLSDNSFKRLDLSDTRTLVGYAPQDDFMALHPRLKDLGLRETMATHSMADPYQQSGLRDDLDEGS